MKKYILIAIIPFIALIVSQTKWPIKGGYGALSDVTGPGTVPLGGMIAIMKSIPSAWQPGTTGVEKDGFQLADGVAFNAGCTLTGSTPPMSTKFLRGNTAASGGTGGAADHELVDNNIPDHVHGSDTYAASLSLSKTVASSTHVHPTTTWNTSANVWGYYSISGANLAYGAPQVWFSNIVGQGSSDLQFSIGAPNSAPTQIVAYSDTPDGDSAATFATESLSLSGSNSITGSSASFGQVTPTAVPTEPPYIETVWVIRCK